MKHWFTTLMALVAALALPLGLKAQDGPVLGASITQIAVSSADQSVSSIAVTHQGSGYNAATTKVTISGGGGTGATAVATVVDGQVVSIEVTSPGSGYTSAPSAVVSDVERVGNDEAVTVVNMGFSIGSIEVTAGGAGYTSAPTVTITGGNGSGALAEAVLNQSGEVKEIVVLNGGGGFTAPPTVTISGGGGAGAKAVAPIGYSVVAIGVTQYDNNNYLTAPTVTLVGGLIDGGVAATAKAVISTEGAFTGIEITSPGMGYKAPPTVVVHGDGVIAVPGGGTDFAGDQITATAAIGPIFYAPFQNESYGPAKTYIVINALAKGTFPEKGYIYKYFVNGVSIGNLGDTVKIPILEEARAAWTPPEPGVYYIHVEVDDNLGNTAKSLAVRYFATGTALQSPLDNTLVPNGSSVVLQASAVGRPQRPNAFVKEVKFFEDGAAEPFATDTTYPYSVIYTPSAEVLDHQIEARAYDNNGNLVSPIDTAVVNLHMVNPEITPLPKVSIVSPTNNRSINVESAIEGGVEVVVAASSASNRIGKVELYVDGVLNGTTALYPYKFNWKPTVAGTYKLVALAYDSKNNVIASTTSTENLKTPAPTVVNISTPPTVSVVAPDKVFEGERVTLTATASTDAIYTDPSTGSDVNASIAYVEFYVDGDYVGSDSTPDSQGRYSTSSAFTQQIDPTTGLPIDSVVLAYAYDDINLQGISSAAYVEVKKGTSDNEGGTGGTDEPIGMEPTISIISPVAQTEIQVNTVVEIIASAADADGKIDTVQFFVDGTLVGAADSIYPYSATWTPTALGEYTITAKTIDNDGNAVRSSAIVVQVKDLSAMAPVVSLQQPTASSAVVGTEISLVADASDPDGSIQRVQFFVNGQPFGAALTAYPFVSSWTPPTPGTYTLYATAVDNVGTVGTSAVKVIQVTTGTAPVVAITTPTNGYAVDAGVAVRITVSATDADDAIKRVRLFVNGAELETMTSAPYSTTWTPSNSGTYVLQAEATDNAGNISVSSEVSLTVRANQVPTVTMTQPGTNTSLTLGSSLVLKATAKDNDGTISKVEFTVNNQTIQTLVAGPYTYSWTPPSEGVYRVAALATDNAGAIVSSKVVSVLVTTDDVNAVDSVYTGTYLGSAESGKFSFINAKGTGGVFIGYSDSGAKVYRYTGMEMLGDGSFASGQNLSGTANAAGVSGYLGAASSAPMFIGQVKVLSGTIPVGLYNGSIVGNATTDVLAIVSADGEITASVQDGSFVDAGRGTIKVANSSPTKGSFTVSMVGGSSLTGTIDLSTGFISATLSGSKSGTVLASNSSALVINDGSMRNLSARGLVGPSTNVVAGFSIGGNSIKKLLIRAVGPTLANYGVPVGSLQADPKLTIHNVDGATPVVVGGNDNWLSSASMTQALATSYAFPLNSGSKDAATIISLPPGMYTATASAVGSQSGVALIEFFDLDADTPFSDSKLVNISAQAQVGTGANTVHAGFVVSGDAPKKVLIRAVGPSLAPYGVTGTLADPAITLRRLVNGAWVDVRENDNAAVGNDKALVIDALMSAGAGLYLSGTDTKSSELLISLPPGTYTAEARSVTGAVGIALIEVYEVP